MTDLIQRLLKTAALMNEAAAYIQMLEERSKPGVRYGCRREGREIVEEPWRAGVMSEIMALHDQGYSIRETVRLLTAKHGRPISFLTVQRTIRREKAK